MTYTEAVHYLYACAPLFQNVGAGAYKEGLSNTHLLDEHFLHPHLKYKTIHVAGTNGKGSCSHTLAAILQSAGYKVGLYTSPHIEDFRERIRVNGKKISQERVVRFIEEEKSFFEPLHPSFFEVTTALAFLYFAEQHVDVAVIEVGLGGRLDCTNIISPVLSVITNISFDHVQFLGNTLAQIAGEKAGIIKPKVPVVIGKTQDETATVFKNRAKEVGAPIVFAQSDPIVLRAQMLENHGMNYETTMGNIWGELGGEYQCENTNTILHACRMLRQGNMQISFDHIKTGFAQVSELTGLHGRWEVVSEHPMVICDSGHNIGGLTYNMAQLEKLLHEKLRIVLGVVSDKDYKGILNLMPKDAVYYFTKASVKRALNENTLLQEACALGLQGRAYAHVKDAAEAALNDASDDDVIYIGGSNFVLSDYFSR